jgi:hypothetical protein
MNVALQLFYLQQFAIACGYGVDGGSNQRQFSTSRTQYKLDCLGISIVVHYAILSLSILFADRDEFDELCVCFTCDGKYEATLFKQERIATFFKQDRIALCPSYGYGKKRIFDTIEEVREEMFRLANLKKDKILPRVSSLIESDIKGMTCIIANIQEFRRPHYENILEKLIIELEWRKSIECKNRKSKQRQKMRKMAMRRTA